MKDLNHCSNKRNKITLSACQWDFDSFNVSSLISQRIVTYKFLIYDCLWHQILTFLVSQMQKILCGLISIIIVSKICLINTKNLGIKPAHMKDLIVSCFMLKKITQKEKNIIRLMADPISCHKALYNCQLLCSFACILHKKR